MGTGEMTVKELGSKRWRMEQLYCITNDDGKKIPFIPNLPQRFLFNNLWHRNIILKARKLGMTTFIDLFILDEALFNDNVEAAIVADNMSHAQSIFRRTIKFAYDHLPPAIKLSRPLLTKSKTELSFPNGSIVSVGVSMRSATPNLLHLSELASVCLKAPDKAREIVTGTLQSVETSGNQMVFIESTAAGRMGYFFDFCQRAQKHGNHKLSKLDFKFFFFPWYQHPGHVLKADIPIPKEITEYFKKLLRSKHNRIKFSIEQKRWYAKQAEVLGPDMKCEHPSTPEEAFEVILEGAFFNQQFIKIREENRICDIPVNPNVPVNTAWDLGMRDATAIWFYQTVDQEIHIIDYYENSEQNLEFYANILRLKGYNYGRHYAPHDIRVRELGSGKSRLETAAELGLKFKTIERVDNKADSIEAARNILKHCWFDEIRCAEGVNCLELYRKHWNTLHGVWDSTPLHDKNSNAADAFQTMSMGHSFGSEMLRLSAGAVDSWTC